MRRYWPEAALLSLLTASIVAQSFLHPIAGMANNGDFAKLTGQFSLGPADTAHNDNFLYFVKDYAVSPHYYWHSGQWSSELGTIRAALALHRLAQTPIFDIRILGAIHAVIFLAAIGLLCWKLRHEHWLTRSITYGMTLWMASDVAYIAYFNSFYMDAGAIVFLLLLLALLINVSTMQAWILATIAACVFITVKSQHTPLVIPLLAFWATRLWPSRRGLTIALIASLSLAAVIYGRFVPGGWRATALYNVVFYRILPMSPDPAATLAELGLDQTLVRYKGIHAFAPDSPAADGAWLFDFYRYCNHFTLAAYYLRHPGVVARSMNHDLVRETWQFRQRNLANFTRDTGYPPGTRSQSFDTWSNFRSRLFIWFPYYAPMWLLAFAIFCRSPLGRLIVAMAALSFATASLLDALETHRHLLLFHLLTDTTILMAAFAIARRFAPVSTSSPAQRFPVSSARREPPLASTSR